MSEKVAVPSSLEIHLLGPFRVALDGIQVEGRRWSRRKPKLLIQLLALQPHHQLHREQTIELLWPDLAPESAANNLHKAIHLARHALEPQLKSAADSHFLITQGQQLILRAPDEMWIDVEVFEKRAAEALKDGEVRACEAALILYEGDLLMEELYEDWVAKRREQLRMARQELLTKLALLYETRGEYQRGIERLKELVVLDSANEEAHRQMMRLYALTGGKQLALRQYRQCCEALQRELDAKPEPATVLLYDQIASGQIRPLSVITTSRDDDESRVIDSLAVLPFVNASADPNAEYLSDGITESIINNLSQLPQLRVMARSTVFRYKGGEADPREVGRDLNVRAVVTGRMLQMGEALIIRTELVDAADGSQLWGEQYNRRLSDILAVQKEISQEISEKLRLKLTHEEQVRLAKNYTKNNEAYQLYLKGRYFKYNRKTKEGLDKAIDYFQQAIERDPNYAAAYAALADCYTILVGRHGLPPEEGLAQAKTAALKALKIDETLPMAHASLAHAMLHKWEWQEAEREFKRAIELTPGDAEVHGVYAEYLQAVGQLEEAITEIKKAQEIDPLSLLFTSNVADTFYFARQYDRSIEQYRKTLEMDPNLYWAHNGLGKAYEQKGMFDDAIAELQKAVETSQGNTGVLASLGHAYAVAGREKEAQDVLDELRDRSKHHCVSPYLIAQIYAGLEEEDQAFQWLEKAYQERDGVMTHLKVEPRLDSLRSDPRFTNLLRLMGLAS